MGDTAPRARTGFADHERRGGELDAQVVSTGKAHETLFELPDRLRRLACPRQERAAFEQGVGVLGAQALEWLECASGRVEIAALEGRAGGFHGALAAVLAAGAARDRGKDADRGEGRTAPPMGPGADGHRALGSNEKGRRPVGRRPHGALPLSRRFSADGGAAREGWRSPPSRRPRGRRCSARERRFGRPRCRRG